MSMRNILIFWGNFGSESKTKLVSNIYELVSWKYMNEKEKLF
jgi:hypothetical protein